MNEIVFKGIKKKLGDFNLSIPKLAIKKGYITGFVGENGAGKTTTIKLIMDMLLPDEGVIEVDGKSVREAGREIKSQIGYVGEPNGYPEEATLENIKKMISPFYKTWEEDLFNKYQEEFGLKMKSKYGKLSTGQKKQFALAMALAHRPRLILLDEPTAGLDPVVRNKILEVLMEHMQDEEVTVFYSTHITSDLEKAGDYIVYIKDGKIRFNVGLSELLETYCIVKGPKHLFAKGIQEHLLGYHVTSFGGEGLVESKEVAAALFGNEVKYVQPTIEEIMVLLSEGRES